MHKVPKLAQLYHYDLQGKREVKYDFLTENSLASINWIELKPEEPNYFFVPKNFDEIKNYEKGFKIDDLLNVNVAGIETIRDAITIHFDSESLKNVINDFLSLDEEEIAKKYNTEDARDWKIGRAKEDVKKNIDNSKVWQNIYYRPFDTRKSFYSGKQNGFVCNGRYNVMKHLLKDNLGLIIPRQTTQDWRHCFITNKIFEGNITASAKLFGTGCAFPLYLYSETGSQQTIDNTTERTPNLNLEIVHQIAEKLGLTFVPDHENIPEKFLIETLHKLPNEPFIRPDDYGYQGCFTPIDLLDYIYAVLHSPTYREKYKEFLKIDFPRVPYPKNVKTFWKLVNIGVQIRELHLLESPIVERYITQYPIDGDNTVTKIKLDENYIIEEDGEKFLIDPIYRFGKVYINDTQYFEGVPIDAWEFYIGGYQPAQKWLKDRKGRTLEFDDILHYQKIIVALTETDKLMIEIDKIKIE
jgi:predicted helicase